MVFSLDSIITAIGMAQDLEIMIAAVVIACVIMYVSSGPWRGSGGSSDHQELALAFLVLIAWRWVADGFKSTFPRLYLLRHRILRRPSEMFNVLASAIARKPLTSGGHSAAAQFLLEMTAWPSSKDRRHVPWSITSDGSAREKIH